MMSLNKILITGANSGLGQHLVAKFSSEGYIIFEHKGKDHFDLRNKEDIKILADEAIEFGVNILINNAAMVCPSLTLEDYHGKLINDMIDVNLRAPILLTYYLMPHLTNIININSMVGLEVKKPRTLYSATKWGLRGFSNSLKLENNRIKILDVYPTRIKTFPDRENALDIDLVINRIYEAFTTNQKRLLLDGRRM